MKIHTIIVSFFVSIIIGTSASAQLITGYWKGKIDHKNVELKIVKNGDSLTGTSYYYASPNNYRRYTIKGYFDSRDNSVVWWDDQLVEDKSSKRLLSSKTGMETYISAAEFNCPGGDKMYLDGKAGLKDGMEEPNSTVALEKKDTHIFKDEWDDVIDNYTIGANDPELIDSIGKLAFTKSIPTETTAVNPTAPAPVAKQIAVAETSKKQLPLPVTKKEPAKTILPESIKPVIVAPLTNEQKFISRSRQLMQQIPIRGDSVELRFYDNAEVDGDSIAIFLNNQLLHEHVRLTDKPYLVKLAVATLQQSNELVMVAENLGSIPPNTSLMVAVIEGKHYEARLESTEHSSALIRFVKE